MPRVLQQDSPTLQRARSVTLMWQLIHAVVGRCSEKKALLLVAETTMASCASGTQTCARASQRSRECRPIMPVVALSAVFLSVSRRGGTKPLHLPSRSQGTPSRGYLVNQRGRRCQCVHTRPRRSCEVLEGARLVGRCCTAVCQCQLSVCLPLQRTRAALAQRRSVKHPGLHGPDGLLQLLPLCGHQRAAAVLFREHCVLWLRGRRGR